MAYQLYKNRPTCVCATRYIVRRREELERTTQHALQWERLRTRYGETTGNIFSSDPLPTDPKKYSFDGRPRRHTPHHQLRTSTPCDCFVKGCCSTTVG
mmetsp:Transcript_10615/g.26359  ORF Transcript_10615/g.26359 Transcript_10615/m.26359 type:complete len:98 (+) Transcript_10615:249-542(+)